MKKFGAVLLVLAALGYYFGFEPSDLLPTLPTSRPAARDRHASATAQQPPAANPQPSVATTPIAQAADGSLENRWQKSPAKP